MTKRVVFFSGRLTDFDNEVLKPEVISYLKKNMRTNGFNLFFEDKSQAHNKVMALHVGRFMSNVKTFFRRTLLKSIPDPTNSGTSLTSLTTSLAKKCFGGAENAKPKHAIWCLITRDFIRSDPELRATPADGNDDNDDNDDELPAALLPAKRTHSGTVKIQTSDGKLIAAFWDRVAKLWKQKTKKFGTADLKSEPWTAYINSCVASEKAMFPTDALTLVVRSGGVTAPTATASSTNRLSGLSQHGAPLEAGGSRSALMPRISNSRASVAPFGSRGSTIDHLMNTPSNFSGVPSGSGSGLHLPPLNMPFHGSDRDAEGTRYQGGRSGQM
ncbi:hypothetical protein B0H14DRAFT_2578887 [Mycena olivaceomarginata]|nr:hypothetical protein B0H14DRAFT_2578887 [Mycena olivaceomarginata]